MPDDPNKLDAATQARMKEIAELNRIIGGAFPPLRADCNEVELADARERALEVRVDQEAQREASDNGAVAPTQQAVNRLKPQWRVRLRAMLPGGGGLSSKLRKAHEALEKAEANREALLAQQQAAYELELQLEGMKERRQTHAANITRARDRLASVKANSIARTAEIDGLLLNDWDDAHGSAVTLACFDAYQSRATADLIVADGPRLERVWAAALAAADRDIAAFRKQHDL